MIRPPRNLSVSLALLLSLGGVSLLAGCSGDGGSESSASPTATPTTSGEVTAEGELPAGWPSDVPVIEGTVLVGAGNASQGRWVVTIDSPSSDPLGEARSQLEDAGYTADKSASAGGTGTVTLANSAYSVLLVSNADGIVYTVTTVGP